MDATQREQAKLQWQSHKCENDNINNMNEALLNMFLEVIDPAYKRHLDNDFVGVINGSFWNVFNGFLNHGVECSKHSKKIQVQLQNYRNPRKTWTLLNANRPNYNGKHTSAKMTI